MEKALKRDTAKVRLCFSTCQLSSGRTARHSTALQIVKYHDTHTLVFCAAMRDACCAAMASLEAGKDRMSAVAAAITVLEVGRKSPNLTTLLRFMLLLRQCLVSLPDEFAWCLWDIDTAMMR